MLGWILDRLPWWTWIAAILVPLVLTYPWWGPIWRSFPRPLRSTIAGVLLALGALLVGRSQGSRSERERQKARDAQAEQRRREVDRAVSNLDPAARERAWNEWLRDK